MRSLSSLCLRIYIYFWVHVIYPLLAVIVAATFITQIKFYLAILHSDNT